MMKRIKKVRRRLEENCGQAARDQSPDPRIARDSTAGRARVHNVFTTYAKPKGKRIQNARRKLEGNCGQATRDQNARRQHARRSTAVRTLEHEA